MLDRRLALRTRSLQLGDLPFAHVPLRIDRLDQEVADQSGGQHCAQDVHGAVVELVARHASLELEFADVVHHNRADDAGSRPRCQQTTVNGADELRTEHVGKIGRHSRETAAIHRQDNAEGTDKQQF